MSVCLRCDWRGETADAACPRCDAPLFRPELRVRPTPRRPPDAGPRSSPARPEPVPGAEPPVDTRSIVRERPSGARRRAAAVATTIAVMIALVVSFDAGRRDDAATPRERQALTDASPPLRGSVVFSRLATSERVQLWRWDLETNEVVEGPVVARPLQLIGAPASGARHVAFTWRGADGNRHAGVLTSLQPDARPRRILAGDLVAWDGRGGWVSAVDVGPAQGCRRRIVVRGVRLAPRLREPTARTTMCGDVVGLAREPALTYLTLQIGDRIHVASSGRRRPTTVLENHALLGVSWAGDMVVQEMRPAAPGAFGRDGRRGVVVAGDLAYFSRRTADLAARPVPFASASAFSVRKILAWSPSSFEALAVGSTSSRPAASRGVFVLDLVPDDGIAQPRWVLEASGPTSATYTGDGVGIVATGGRIYALHDGGVTEVPMPFGAPLADGLVAWIP